jgi:hypothetical protein
MDFIERIFGLSPDGGNGTTEVLYFFTLATVIIVVFRKPIFRMLFKNKA